jgi:hypothetical protein
MGCGASVPYDSPYRGSPTAAPSVSCRDRDRSPGSGAMLLSSTTGVPPPLARTASNPSSTQSQNSADREKGSELDAATLQVGRGGRREFARASGPWDCRRCSRRWGPFDRFDALGDSHV